MKAAAGCIKSSFKFGAWGGGYGGDGGSWPITDQSANPSERRSVSLAYGEIAPAVVCMAWRMAIGSRGQTDTHTDTRTSPVMA
jgi:hypothetical protein